MIPYRDLQPGQWFYYSNILRGVKRYGIKLGDGRALDLATREIVSVHPNQKVLTQAGLVITGLHIGYHNGTAALIRHGKLTSTVYPVLLAGAHEVPTREINFVERETPGKAKAPEYHIIITVKRTQEGEVKI